MNFVVSRFNLLFEMNRAICNRASPATGRSSLQHTRATPAAYVPRAVAQPQDRPRAARRVQPLPPHAARFEAGSARFFPAVRVIVFHGTPCPAGLLQWRDATGQKKSFLEPVCELRE